MCRPRLRSSQSETHLHPERRRAPKTLKSPLALHASYAEPRNRAPTVDTAFLVRFYPVFTGMNARHPGSVTIGAVSEYTCFLGILAQARPMIRLVAIWIVSLRSLREIHPKFYSYAEVYEIPVNAGPRNVGWSNKRELQNRESHRQWHCLRRCELHLNRADTGPYSPILLEAC
jgi:hypothetical protein